MQSYNSLFGNMFLFGGHTERAADREREAQKLNDYLHQASRDIQDRYNRENRQSRPNNNTYHNPIDIDMNKNYPYSLNTLDTSNTSSLGSLLSAYMALQGSQLFQQLEFSKHYFNPNVHSIHLAVLSNDLEKVKNLVRKNPGLIHEVDPNGKTPLSLAESKKYRTIASYLRSKTSFVDLYPEIILKIFSMLTLETSAKKILPLNKKFNALFKNNLFWLETFERQFPHVLPTVLNKFKNVLVPLKISAIDWYAEFLKTYDDQYTVTQNNSTKKLSKSVRALFSIIKNNDTRSCYDERSQLVSQLYDPLSECDKNGKSMLAWAQDKNDQAMLDYLYQLKQIVFTVGGKLNTQLKIDGKTILYWAIALHQNQKEINSLIQQGSQLNEEYDDQEYFPIHIAAQQGRLDLVELIIANRPEYLNATDRHGQTALLHAAKNNHLDVVQYLLLQDKINIEATSQNFKLEADNNKSALHWAAECADSEVGIALLNVGANSTLPANGNHFLPIHFASESGKVDLVDALIRKRPDFLNSPDSYQETPLILAASNGHKVLVDLLLKKDSINLNAQVQNFNEIIDGNTALHFAAEKGHDDIVIALIKAGADATLPAGKDKSLPIHLASIKRQFAVLRAFIKYQPELLDKTDGNGKTALQLLSKEERDVIEIEIETMKNNIKNNNEQTLQQSFMIFPPRPRNSQTNLSEESNPYRVDIERPTLG